MRDEYYQSSRPNRIMLRAAAATALAGVSFMGCTTTEKVRVPVLPGTTEIPEVPISTLALQEEVTNTTVNDQELSRQSVSEYVNSLASTIDDMMESERPDQNPVPSRDTSNLNEPTLTKLITKDVQNTDGTYTKFRAKTVYETAQQDANPKTAPVKLLVISRQDLSSLNAGAVSSQEYEMRFVGLPEDNWRLFIVIDGTEKIYTTEANPRGAAEDGLPLTQAVSKGAFEEATIFLSTMQRLEGITV